MFRKHIAFKLITGYVLIVLISMLAIGIFFIQMFRQYTFENTETTLLYRAHSIADMMPDYTENNGPMRGFGSFMRFLDTMTEAKVWITDNQGNPALFSGMGIGIGMGNPARAINSEPLPDAAQEVIEQVLAGKEAVHESFSSSYNETILTVGVPIPDENKQISGAVLLLAPEKGLTATVNKAKRILGISLLLALIPALGLGIYFSLLFTRPLKTMNRTALEMAQGNYGVRSGIARPDELGQLSNSLDLLATKLGSTINQLFQEKGKMSDIISSISEGLIAFDLDLKPLNVNAALSKIMNRPLPYPGDELSKDLTELNINQEILGVRQDKKVVQVVRDWQDKKLKLTLSPIIDNSGQITGSVALVQDISESERLEQFRQDFIANVSHEFRTPLTVFKGSLEAIMDGLVEQPSDLRRYYERMLAETHSLERLVTDLLELSRLQSHKISLNIESVHIPTLLKDTVNSLQTIADKKNIHIAYHQLAELPPVLGDYDRLRQLFVIFLDNAIKYSPEHTMVTVEASAGQTLDVVICDQGYGIAEETLPYIWERFYKEDKSRKSNGTGLGLAIAKHLIELHHGQVTLKSSLGKGTSVKVSLPYSQPGI
ncbi:histidine kinase [Desulfosporosinus sp. Tol-M]|nr:histidine kinase [Desulfosporosinus sp. Tol-M]